MAFAQIGSLRLYYERHGPTHGTPVVLLMGLGVDGSGWALQLGALAPVDPCIVPDNRGVGRSDAPDVPYTNCDMAGDVLGVLDALAIPRAHLLGLSMGGAIAQEVTLVAPTRVASLQLHATWAGGDPYLQAVIAGARLARRHLEPEAFLQVFLPWVFSAETYARRPDLIASVTRQTLANPYPQSLHGYLRQAEAVAGHDARARLPAIRCPTLVTVGTEDLLTPPRLGRELAALIPGARYAVIEGVGHGVNWEAPEAFNRRCLEFLASVESP